MNRGKVTDGEFVMAAIPAVIVVTAIINDARCRFRRRFNILPFLCCGRWQHALVVSIVVIVIVVIVIVTVSR